MSDKSLTLDATKVAPCQQPKYHSHLQPELQYKGVIDKERLSERMKAAGMTQAGLARRLGVTSQTIGKLVRGQASGSSHLHRIARELGTSADYLLGDSSDPNPDPATPALNRFQTDLLAATNGLSEQDQLTILKIARALGN